MSWSFIHTDNRPNRPPGNLCPQRGIFLEIHVSPAAVSSGRTEGASPVRTCMQYAAGTGPTAEGSYNTNVRTDGHGSELGGRTGATGRHCISGRQAKRERKEREGWSSVLALLDVTSAGCCRVSLTWCEAGERGAGKQVSAAARGLSGERVRGLEPSRAKNQKKKEQTLNTASRAKNMREEDPRSFFSTAAAASTHSSHTHECLCGSIATERGAAENIEETQRLSFFCSFGRDIALSFWGVFFIHFIFERWPRLDRG